jgi:hypothetical protein
MKTLLAAAALALIATSEVSAQSASALYGSDGRVVGRSTTDSQGTVTTFGTDGRVISREATTRSGATTVYDGPSGRAVGTITKGSDGLQSRDDCDQAGGKQTACGEGSSASRPKPAPLRRKLYGASLAEPEAQDRADAQQRAFEEWQQRASEQAQQPARTRKRKQTLAGVAKQAAKAGIPVAGYEVRPDGSIGVVTGKPAGNGIDMDDAAPIDRSEWH